MADYRQVHTKIWDDPWYVDLSPEGKLFFIWLVTNDKASVSGLYEFSVAVAARETGIDRKVITECIKQFTADGKIMVEGNYIWVKNLRKYNDSGSPNAYKRIMTDLELLPVNGMKAAYMLYYGHKAVEEQSVEEQVTPCQPLTNPLITPSGTGNREQGTGNIEHRTLNTEHRTKLNQSPLSAGEFFSQDAVDWLAEYAQITGIKPRNSDAQKWQQEAIDCMDAGIDAALIRRTVDYMRSDEKKLTVGSPKSIYVTALNLKAKSANSDTSHNRYLSGPYAHFINRDEEEVESQVESEVEA